MLERTIWMTPHLMGNKHRRWYQRFFTSAQAASEMILLVSRKATSIVKSLGQLRPPFRQKFPSKDNSIFFVLRSSTDLSFIKSVNGFGPEQIQVWSSSGKVNHRLKEAFDLYEHVFCFAMFGDRMWGFLRMSSPPDEAEYGKVKFWCDEEGDETLWSWLGVNWRVQWLCECEVSIDALPRFDENKTNRDFLLSEGNTAKDGACLGDCKGHFWKNEEGFKACWKVANALLQSERSPHGIKTPRRTKPAWTTQVYDEHVPRPACAEYSRKNLTSQAQAPDQKAQTKKECQISGPLQAPVEGLAPTGVVH